MISAFIGSPGSGKSTAAAWVARKATRQPNKVIRVAGQPISSGHANVVTNFDFPGAFKLHWDKLGNTQIDDALIIIDEIMLLADSRDFKSYSKDIKFFMSQHRKYDCDILWMSQAYDDVDKKIRNLTTKYFLLTPFIFDFYKLTSIDHFVDIVDHQIVSGYEFGRKHYFWGRPIYKLFDSFNTVNVAKEMEPYPLEMWG